MLNIEMCENCKCKCRTFLGISILCVHRINKTDLEDTNLPGALDFPVLRFPTFLCISRLFRYMYSTSYLSLLLEPFSLNPTSETLPP
jgi:hypothetical protein